jgi:hypothetical protein
MTQTLIGAIKIASKKRNLSVEEYLEITKTKKWCYLGKHWKDKTKFVIDNSRHDKLGYKCSDCTKSKNPYFSAKGKVSTFKGKKHTEETKRRASEMKKGSKSPMEGKHHTLEARMKISQMLRERGAKGINCHSYKDGLTAERRGIRFSFEYKRWRFDVFFRDKFICQHCGDNKGGNLNAHHIKSFAEYPELRFEINNGITLCEECHKKEHAKI